MTVSLVQYKTATASGSPASLTYDVNPTAGHLLVAVFVNRGVGSTPTTPTGWTLAGRGGPNVSDNDSFYWRIAPGGAVTVTVAGVTNETRLYILEFDNTGVPTAVDVETTTAHGSVAWTGSKYPFPMGSVNVTSDEAVLVAFCATSDPGGGSHVTFDPDPLWTTVAQGSTFSLTPESVVAYRSVSAPDLYSWDPSNNDYPVGYGGVVVAFEIAPEFTADFTGTPRSGNIPLTVGFEDQSFGGTGTPNAWLWDFGDGGTSTSQNPSHIYTVTGNYSVTLTVTTDDAETDSVTHDFFITAGDAYVPPDPGGAILEIKASAIGSPRWGSAHWGEDFWSASGWVDITPQGITVTIRWGSHQPERGVLLETEAASWLVTTYDPDRLLDPGNEDSPYHADLVAGLPIRLRHRGTVIRQGYVERLAYSHADSQGGIRATDNVSLMARTPVPEDSVVADTLRERARDVIAAAGLRITVEPDPPAGDPALAPRLDGDHSVWRHIADAAEQTLNIPYVDRIGTLKFRPWASPYDRSRSVDDTNLVDLVAQVDSAGLFSVVQARDEITEALVERRITPAPKYGRVTYTRDDLTPDAAGWADAVLLDRSLQTVQWIPGLIWPLTADDVEYFATLEAMERLGVDHNATTPPVHVTGIIVGGEVRVKGKKDSAALWSFELELSQTADAPLYVDDADPPEFLYHEDGFTLLYPD